MNIFKKRNWLQYVCYKYTRELSTCTIQLQAGGDLMYHLPPMIARFAVLDGGESKPPALGHQPGYSQTCCSVVEVQ